MLPEIAITSVERDEDGDALIEQGLAATSNFLSAPDSAPAETELLFEPLAATETVAEEFDGIDFCHDSALMLSAAQAEQIAQFRNGLHSCTSDEDKFRLCMDTRDDLLS